jgi:hypothetical protein
MFDSPFEYCKTCGEYVLLDQTNAECAREHNCRDAAGCVLRRFFTGIEFRKAEAATDGRPAKRPHKPKRSVTG